MGSGPRKYTVAMILSSASAGFPGAWLLALVAVAAYVLAAFPSRSEGRRLPSALVVGVVLHAMLLLLDISGLGSDTGGARFGFGPVVSLTVWLVLAVHTAESRLVPQPGVRRVLALLGAGAVLLAWALPGEPQPLTGTPWAPLHWVLGVGSYGLFGAAVLHATMLDAAETRMRQHAGGPPRAFGMPLLQLERLTFRFVEAGFVVLSAALVLGALTSPQWRWNHKTVFSLLGWAVIRSAAGRPQAAGLARPSRHALAVRRRRAVAAGLCRLALRHAVRARPATRLTPMKYLIVLLVVVVVFWWLLRSRKPMKVASRRPAGDGSPQAMLQCSHCGVHLPRVDALVDERGAFCTEAHRLAGPRAR